MVNQLYIILFVSFSDCESWMLSGHSTQWRFLSKAELFRLEGTWCLNNVGETLPRFVIGNFFKNLISDFIFNYLFWPPLCLTLTLNLLQIFGNSKFTVKICLFCFGLNEINQNFGFYNWFIFWKRRLFYEEQYWYFQRGNYPVARFYRHAAAMTSTFYDMLIICADVLY